MVTLEKTNFLFAMLDVKELIDRHEELSGARRGPQPRELEVYKRAALILTVTAWESYIEDTIRCTARAQIIGAKQPADLEERIKQVLKDTHKPSGSVSIDTAAAWIVGWRQALLDGLSEDLESLHTPGPKQVSDLSKKYLGKDLTELWSWRNMKSASAKRKLSKLIKLRGELVHRGGELFRRRPIAITTVRDYVAFARRLVERTEVACSVPRAYEVQARPGPDGSDEGDRR